MKPKILIADDDQIGRKMLEAVLVRAGHEVIVTGDGDEAWGVLQRTATPLLAILDWNMPGIDGPSLCRRIRQLLAARQLYVVLLTARTGRESVIQGLEAGAHDYITKPFDPDEMQARLRVGLRVLGLQQTLAERVEELELALANVKRLEGLLPMCCYCKSIRKDQDYWQRVEHYLCDHAEVAFSHGICPDCYKSVVEPQLSAFVPNAEEVQG